MDGAGVSKRETENREIDRELKGVSEFYGLSERREKREKVKLGGWEAGEARVGWGFFRFSFYFFPFFGL